jgi:hypothetical protein
VSVTDDPEPGPDTPAGETPAASTEETPALRGAGALDSPGIPGADASPPHAAAPPAGFVPRPSRGQRIGAAVLLWLAGVFVILSIHAVWVNRQVLDPHNWGETSTKVLANSEVRTQLSTFLVSQIYARTDITSQVRSALPPKLQPLAGPITGGLRQAGEKAVHSLLGLPAAQTIWRVANEQAIRQFDNVVEEKNTVVTSHDDALILDVRPVLVQVADRLGLSQKIVDGLPKSAGRITIASSRRVKQIKGGVKLLKGLQVILPVVAFLLGVAAIWLSEGRRRRALLLCGVALVAAGLFVVIERNILGRELVGALVSDETIQPAAHDAFSILTAMLSDIAQSVILFGVAVLVCAAVAGPRRWAVTVRRAGAPWLAERIGVCLTVVAAVFGLLVWWAPIPALRMPIPALIMLALLLLGTLVLRRQTATEFPDARIGDTEAAVRAWWKRTRSPSGTAGA